jgi:hypothetical protein
MTAQVGFNVQVPVPFSDQPGLAKGIVPKLNGAGKPHAAEKCSNGDTHISTDVINPDDSECHLNGSDGGYMLNAT